MRTLIWHHDDLRLKENFALRAALKKSTHLLPLFIYTEEIERQGSASNWWLHHSLSSLSSLYQERGSRLFFLKGDPLILIPALVKEMQISKVCWNINFVPSLFQTQHILASLLEELGVFVEQYNSNYLIDPRNVYAKNTKPYTVFSHFYKTALKILPSFEKPSSLQKLFPPPPPGIQKTSVEKISPLPSFSWHSKLAAHWKPGSTQGELMAKTFCTTQIYTYETHRDFPFLFGTSKLSAYLHFGEVSPHSLWRIAEDAPSFQRQLLWREFATYLLFHNPHMTKENWNPRFDNFVWDRSSTLLKAWEGGKTGYPIIDAGMRQLWETGWMHNRVRMIVASFLTKDLLLHWKNGERWFWDTLVDADIANNALGWQWVAGSGPDAAPYFRIFNPILQSKKFDSEGLYIKTYLPELSALSSKWIHAPWLAPQELLAKAGIVLGKTYPYPIVDHEKARLTALTRFKACK